MRLDGEDLGGNPGSAPDEGGQSWDPGLYEEKHAFVWKSAADLVELLAPKAGERVLDLGCGTGRLTAEIAGRGCEVEGIDSAVEMIDEARRRYPTLTFRVADALSMEYTPAFDAVFSNAALHWIRPPERVARRVWEALRPGGRFVAELGAKGNVKAIVQAITLAVTAFSPERPSFEHPWYFPSMGEYATLLEQQGFLVTYATVFDRPTPLEAGRQGLRNWMAMFAGGLLKGLSDKDRSSAMGVVEERLAPTHYRDGAWVVDYRRIRVAAVKG